MCHVRRHTIEYVWRCHKDLLGTINPAPQGNALCRADVLQPAFRSRPEPPEIRSGRAGLRLIADVARVPQARRPRILKPRERSPGVQRSKRKDGAPAVLTCPPRPDKPLIG